MHAVIPLLSLAFAGVAPPCTAEDDRAPVILRKWDPTPPPEAWGSEFAPAVTVRLHLDTKGKVTSIEIRRIEPSSDLDPLFEKEVRDTVSEWRFAPAYKGGQPVEATLEWTIEFSKMSGEAPTPRWSGGLVLDNERAKDSEVEAWYRYVSGLPPAERIKLLDKARRDAEGLLNAANRRVAATTHVEAVTDAPGADASVLARDVEAAYGTVAKLLASKIPPQPIEDRLVVVVYSSETAFRTFAARRHIAQFADGFFDPVGLLAFHVRMEANEILLHTMVHEAVHAFLERHVVRAGIRLPVWLHEGLAEYVAMSDIKDGRILPGSHKHKMMVYHNPTLSSAARSMWNVGAVGVRKALRSGSAIPLDQLVSATPDTFYGEKHEVFYAESWLFVHFLRHGKASWAEEEFPRFVLYVAEGFAPEDAFRGVYGCAPSELGEAFRAYVEKF